MNKVCTKCKVSKPYSEFHRRKSKLGITSHCKRCINAANKAGYQKHWGERRQSIDSYHYKRIDQLRYHIDTIKGNIGCQHCGYNEHPVALEFHHLIPDDKVRTISSLINRKVKESTLIAEINKCVILCANCHRLFHNGIITLQDMHPVHLTSLTP